MLANLLRMESGMRSDFSIQNNASYGGRKGVGYMRVSSESDRQITDLQRDALLAAGVDGRHLFEDHASGAKDDRPGLTQALSCGPEMSSSSGSWIA